VSVFWGARSPGGSQEPIPPHDFHTRRTLGSTDNSIRTDDERYAAMAGDPDEADRRWAALYKAEHALPWRWFDVQVSVEWLENFLKELLATNPQLTQNKAVELCRNRATRQKVIDAYKAVQDIKGPGKRGPKGPRKTKI
jgi:hypothetical protein